MTFETVSATFERLYEELREANGENAPNSYTWIAPTLAEIIADREDAADATYTSEIGGGDPVAFAYECNGRTVARINNGATEDEVEILLGSFMGIDD